jgi:peptide/nickel transport system ATP-binding protein
MTETLPGEPLLRVEDLRVEFPTEDGIVHAVDGISYDVRAGGTLGIVGESGSGKTVAALTAMGLTRRMGARISGRIMFAGRDLLTLSEEEMRRLRGNEIAMVFQDPLSSLHPLYTVGAQIVEGIRAHRDVSKAQSRARARPPCRPVSARALRRHAPARDDRDGARQRTAAADRRRAHDRT